MATVTKRFREIEDAKRKKKIPPTEKEPGINEPPGLLTLRSRDCADGLGLNSNNCQQSLKLSLRLTIIGR